PRLAPGAKVSVLVRPENIETVAAGEGGENVIAARVTGRLFQGEFSEFQFTAGNLVLTGRMHPSFRASQGESVQLRLRPKACVVLTASGPSSPP
ncbi:MAG: TOBE domain-containing protein, partial [Alphaproteobacteria bacterium]|nr:TOBE domain-containing protein [Alphaproteobacteria bacterium]